MALEVNLGSVRRSIGILVVSRREIGQYSLRTP
jgi:hypothetical protein